MTADNGTTRTETIHLRLRPDDLAPFREDAERRGLPLSEVLREALAVSRRPLAAVEFLENCIAGLRTRRKNIQKFMATEDVLDVERDAFQTALASNARTITEHESALASVLGEN